MTQVEIEKQLDMIKYYDAVVDMWQHYADNYPYPDLSPCYKEELMDMIQRASQEGTERYNSYREEAIRLLDYCGSETDKEVLYRHYVLHQEYFDIAEEMFYSYSYIIKKVRNALKRLAENLKDYPAASC